MKESMQLREFELEEKLNHLEDKVEWVNEDKGNLKAELDDTLELVKKYVSMYMILINLMIRCRFNKNFTALVIDDLIDL